VREREREKGEGERGRNPVEESERDRAKIAEQRGKRVVSKGGGGDSLSAARLAQCR